MNKNTNFENAEFKVVLKKFLRDWSALEYEYNPPSALRAEQRYEQYGVKLPFKLHYKYKMPFGMESSYDLLFWLPFGEMGLEPPVTLKEFADFHKINIDDLSEGDKKRFLVYQTVSAKQLDMIMDWVRQISAVHMIAEIKRLNPELAHIKTDGKTSGVAKPVQDFICGVAYGFSPEDIELCLTSRYGDLQEIANSPRYQKLRFGHYTTPERYEALLVAEQQIQQIEQAKQKNGHE